MQDKSPRNFNILREEPSREAEFQRGGGGNPRQQRVREQSIVFLEGKSRMALPVTSSLPHHPPASQPPITKRVSPHVCALFCAYIVTGECEFLLLTHCIDKIFSSKCRDITNTLDETFPHHRVLLKQLSFCSGGAKNFCTFLHHRHMPLIHINLICKDSHVIATQIITHTHTQRKT